AAGPRGAAAPTPAAGARADTNACHSIRAKTARASVCCTAAKGQHAGAAAYSAVAAASNNTRPPAHFAVAAVSLNAALTRPSPGLNSKALVRRHLDKAVARCNSAKDERNIDS